MISPLKVYSQSKNLGGINLIVLYRLMQMLKVFEKINYFYPISQILKIGYKIKNVCLKSKCYKK